jgi:hypothetical protein
MLDPRIRLKNRVLAVVLAWLIPGAGHLYQGRRLKSAIYFCSIVGLWIMAMHLSEWKVMAAPHTERDERPPMIQMLKFGAQSGVGLPSVCAMVQRERSKQNQANKRGQSHEAFETSAEGTLRYRSVDDREKDGPVSGEIEFEIVEGALGPSYVGHFSGENGAGESVEFELGKGVSLGSEIDGHHRRSLRGEVTLNGSTVADFEGSIPRSTWNWLFMPLNMQQEMDLHERLGKMHELATLLSVVAGLLNILAIFDAFGGPAYGYGDEQLEPGPA